MKVELINELLNISESYQAPQKMLEFMLDDSGRRKLFQSFLEHETDLSYEWFQSYFEDEHSDRKAKKQDFTPNDISELLSRIPGDDGNYFESAVGTGGILIKYWNQYEDKEKFDCRVEELSERAIPFLLFNMSIRGMNGVVSKGDSLTGEFDAIYKLTKNGRFSDIEVVKKQPETKHGTILMNPPYSSKWSADKDLLKDSRFKKFERLAPKSKADFAFLLHGYHQLDESGTMAVVLPHGVLFRGAAEGVIRKKLLEMGAIDSIIGLPEKLFFNTSIPTAIIILKKNRTQKDVLFIDASKEFKKGKNQNFLREEHIDKILKVYQERKFTDKYAYLAEFEELKENEFNLNIPRYVDTFEEPEPIDIVAVSNEILQIDKEIERAEAELVGMLKELEGTAESIDIINATKMVFGENLLKGEAKMLEAKKRISSEMEKVESSYVQVVGEFLLEQLERDPSIADKLTREDKTIVGSLSEMRKEAKKNEVDGVAVLSDEEGFAVVLKYFGIDADVKVPFVESPSQATAAEEEKERENNESLVTDSVEFNVTLEDLL